MTTTIKAIHPHDKIPDAVWLKLACGHRVESKDHGYRVDDKVICRRCQWIAEQKHE